MLSLPIALTSYLAPEDLSYLPALTALGVSMIGGALEYVYLSGLYSIREIIEREHITYRSILMPALAVGSYIGLLGIYLSYKINKDFLEYLFEKPVFETECAKYYEPFLGIVSLGFHLTLLQECTHRVSLRVRDVCISRDSVTVDLSTE